MATSQDECVSSEGHPSYTPPSQDILMECDMVEPLGCDMSAVAENLSNQPQNISGDVVDNGEKSNKELPDHGCQQEDKIPRVGIRFAQLQMAHDFYVTYAKKVGFATKMMTITYDKITKAPINQAIHCNHDRYHGSRVKAPSQKNTISAAGYKTFLALANEAGGPSNLGFSDKDLRNYITRLRTSNVNADVRGMMSYFMRMKDINPNFFYAVKLDEECKFKGAVWVNARCRASYEYYGDVVSVDSTYSTNRHGFPFVSFVGVNHYGKSTLLGCALSENEEIPNLYDDRHMWVPIYFKGEFWAAMRSTQRSESMYAFYGGFLHSRTSLVQFVHEYDNVLEVNKRRKLEDDAANSRKVIPCATSSPMENQFQQEYTTSMFRSVHKGF
ncbi:protein FAR1-RELATED SEQUENCE 5-like [Arachis hypogaea]|uniref:protein FAR1-RELATED SEQUENCE 5-like n=1 Tax=Arachis hypogaea TaxID=3818 RepID=UPI003B214B15